MCRDGGIIQEVIVEGFAKAWGTKMEIVRICGAPKPWEATGGVRGLAPKVSGAWLVLQRPKTQDQARNQSWRNQDCRKKIFYRLAGSVQNWVG